MNSERCMECRIAHHISLTLIELGGWRATGGEGEDPASRRSVDDESAPKPWRSRRGGAGSGGGAIGAPAFWLHLCRRTKVEENQKTLL